MCLGGSCSLKLTVEKQGLWARDAQNPAWGFPQDPPSERFSQSRLPLPPQKPFKRETYRPSSEALSCGGGLSHLRRPRGASSAVGPGWQGRCRLMDRFPMRVLCRLPAVPAQAPDQHGCTAPHPARKCRSGETSHPGRAAINLRRRQAEDRTERPSAS